MASRWCGEDVMVANNYFFNPMRWVMGLTVFVGMYQFNKAYQAGKLGGESKRSFIMVMMFFGMVAITCLFQSFFMMAVCSEPFEVWRPIHIVFNTGASWSMAWSCAFFYYRLYKVFHGTAFAMSKPTQIVTTVLLVWILFQGLASAMITSFHYVPFIITIISFAFKLIIGFAAWIAFMFIWKLRQIHVFMASGDLSANDQEFRNVATKTTLLWTLNIAITLLLDSVQQIGINNERQGTRILINFLTPWFVFFDFVAVFMSYNRFDSAYKRVFGKCHNACLWLWEKRSPIEKQLAQVASGTSKDTTTEVTATSDVTATDGAKSTALTVDTMASTETSQGTVTTNAQSVDTTGQSGIEIV